MAFARMKELVRDIVFATRRLLASRGFTAFAIATLALGIGATTAIYSVIYAAALRPPSIRAVHRGRPACPAVRACPIPRRRPRRLLLPRATRSERRSERGAAAPLRFVADE